MSPLALYAALAVNLPGAPASQPAEPAIDVNYRRAYLAEVCADLHARAGWRCAYPASLAERGTVTLQAKSAPPLAVGLQVVLDLGVRFTGKVSGARRDAIFWRPAEDARLAGLTRQLRDADEGQACSAAAALGRLADKRAFSALIEALKDERPRVRCWVFNALEDQIPAPTPGRVSILPWCLPKGGGKIVADGLAAVQHPVAIGFDKGAA